MGCYLHETNTDMRNVSFFNTIQYAICYVNNSVLFHSLSQNVDYFPTKCDSFTILNIVSFRFAHPRITVRIFARGFREQRRRRLPDGETETVRKGDCAAGTGKRREKDGSGRRKASFFYAGNVNTAIPRNPRTAQQKQEPPRCGRLLQGRGAACGRCVFAVCGLRCAAKTFPAGACQACGGNATISSILKRAAASTAWGMPAGITMHWPACSACAWPPTVIFASPSST